ncbi:MAG TPA: Lrp/AsnC family transcriptional regulator [Zoogloea sp.]|uniref:siroheme decarboxylase subunit beta n=1 Tax=Zoogloea sp. TaxID=49181 RepID=UPI002C07226A|nr:Lrp/AsnC family transcriptional regulator [Zoogloea sp.]HMV18566.1 Lrp/AsnC family transcriptional regulator [Rhodocyclaceae bacterium]HMV64722.1 Lrp/AsnC family transcriptional regulator [Rhodocyclaceae bacterium]HMW53420.1 Lrp/AsnC family transcriptional regulator [Rhodocyclaceae bacterium]HMY50721.1 Lrp/AsnC family transcriptional regulator [Rhodocyclaceae bacterium]HMZ77680.1 Lrp/AsnC family transcriptional regulator [Rhodocyclaceae bacterium]
MLTADARDFHLLNDFQRGFPLRAEPWAALAAHLGCGADEVMQRLARLRDSGKISRVGPVFAPNRLGASTLAAMAVPPAELPRVAALVSAFAGVNHNYRREHRFNLWFVAAAADERALNGLLAAIGSATGCPPVALPLVEEFHIDLGFDLANGRRTRHKPAPVGMKRALSAAEWRLVEALQDGLPWVPRPYRAVADAAGLNEEDVLATLAAWLAEGTLRRFGVVVRHRELGWDANAMCVWAVPEAAVSAAGRALAAQDGVSLCYRRRTAPEWPYSLFCMLHGRSRAEVEARRMTVADAAGVAGYPSAVLFSTDCYKQCGARYRDATPQPACVS